MNILIVNNFLLLKICLFIDITHAYYGLWMKPVNVSACPLLMRAVTSISYHFFNVRRILYTH